MIRLLLVALFTLGIVGLFSDQATAKSLTSLENDLKTSKEIKLAKFN